MSKLHLYTCFYIIYYMLLVTWDFLCTLTPLCWSIQITSKAMAANYLWLSVRGDALIWYCQSSMDDWQLKKKSAQALLLNTIICVACVTMETKRPPLDCVPICEHIMMHHSVTGHLIIGSHQLPLILGNPFFQTTHQTWDCCLLLAYMDISLLRMSLMNLLYGGHTSVWVIMAWV